MELPGLAPEKINIFGFELSETVVTCFVVTILLIIFALVVRFFLLKNFKRKPKGFQLLLEMAVDGINKFTYSMLHGKGSSLAGYFFSIAALLIFSGMVELLGVRAPGTDLSFTVTLALLTFILINAYGVYYKGFLGRVKSFGKPKVFVAPIRVLSDIAVPISLACRMFGNLFSGLIIMDLIYAALGYFAIALPGFLSLYFNLFHVVMQTYVFVMLSLSFIKEAVED